MIKIDNRIISLSSNPLIIPEIGINHSGRLENAIKIVDAAKRAGAEIIKHQTHAIDDEMSIEAKRIKPGNSNKDIFSIIKNNSLSYEDEYKLFKYVKSKKMIYLSTPFSKNAVDRLVKFGVNAFKVGSGEMSNFPLLDHIVKQKKNLIVSTGLHTLSQVKKTYKFLKDRKARFALLHTTNIYPCKDKYLRLESLSQLKKEFSDTVIGLSDHTGDLLSSYVGLTLGAKIIEKHFIHKKKVKGPDISSSIDEKQLKELIYNSKRISLQMKGNKNILLKEEEVTRNFAFASVVSTNEIKKGKKFTLSDLTVMRPGNGDFKSSELKKLIGKISTRIIKKNTQIKKNDFK